MRHNRGTLNIDPDHGKDRTMAKRQAGQLYPVAKAILRPCFATALHSVRLLPHSSR